MGFIKAIIVALVVVIVVSVCCVVCGGVVSISVVRCPGILVLREESRGPPVASRQTTEERGGEPWSAVVSSISHQAGQGPHQPSRTNKEMFYKCYFRVISRRSFAL